MHKKRVVGLVIVIAVMLILVGLKGFIDSKMASYVASTSTSATGPVATTNTPNPAVHTLSTNTQSATPTSTDPLAACIAKDQAALKNTKYQPGSLLVTFQKTVSWDQGKQIVAAYNLHYATSTDNQTGFGDQAWVEVTVPNGQEIAYLCKLSTDSNIKHVSINPIFDLHE